MRPSKQAPGASSGPGREAYGEMETGKPREETKGKGRRKTENVEKVKEERKF